MRRRIRIKGEVAKKNYSEEVEWEGDKGFRCV